MAQTSKRQQNVRLEVELLESRLAPATLPLNQNPLQLLGTYGQYQDGPVGGFDNNIHMHEGLDMLAARGTAVLSVQRGRVDAIHTDPTTPAFSFVVIRDVDAANNDAPLATGFNYKHTIPWGGYAPSPLLPHEPPIGNSLAVGDIVAQGQLIGTVAAFPAPLPDHLHLDRGNNGATVPANNLQARDPTIATLLPGLNANIAALQVQVTQLTQQLGMLPLTHALRPQVQAALTRATTQLTTATSFRNAIRWQFPTVLNPMSVLGPLVVDQTPPTINALDFRLGADDLLGTTRNIGALFGQFAEQPRNNSRYFRGTLTVGGQARIQLGRLATVTAPGANPVPPASTAQQRGNIDFVVDAFDQFGAAGQAQNIRLNPNSFDLTVTGTAFGATSGQRESFDFSAFPTYTGLGNFFNLVNTRAVYENDSTHNSSTALPGSVPPVVNRGALFYTFTNSPNLNVAPGGMIQQGDIQATYRPLSWNSDAATGTAFATANDAANNATRNANAAFPDDIYTIQIGATDFAGNRTSRDFPVVLTNWARTIQTSAAVYDANVGGISVTGGFQYRANQDVNIHLVPAGNQITLASGTPLNNGNFVRSATTDANGVLDPALCGGITFATPPPGRYFVIANYNGDGEFTNTLDAFTIITIRGNAQAQLNPNPIAPAVGQNVILTASVSAVAPATGTPTGTVTFFDGLVNLGTSTLVNGTATLVVNSLAAGDHALRAEYNGSDLFTETSATADQTVHALSTDKLTPQTTLTAGSAPTVFGQPLTLTATVAAVAPDTGTPTGTVTFFSGGHPLGTATVVNGTASITVNNLDAGSYDFTADYSGDDDFNFAPGSASQTVNPADVALTVSASASSTTYGADVQFTVTVSATGGTPTGSVDFSEGGTSFGSATLVDGAAVFTLNSLTAGAHTLTVTYSGDGNFNSGTGTVAASVSQQGTTTTGYTLSNPVPSWEPPFFTGLGGESDDPPALPPANTSVAGQQITIMALIGPASPGAAAPTGWVTFYNGSISLGASAVSGGQATLTINGIINGLDAGSHTITLSYGGDTNYAPSTGTVVQTVIQGDSTTSLTTSSNESLEGQAVSLSANVLAAAPADGIATGVVDFYDDDHLIGSANLSAGWATLSVSDLTPGVHHLTAVYEGDNNFTCSMNPSSETMTIYGAPTFTSAASFTFTTGIAGTFTVTTGGFPVPTLTEWGALPEGVLFTDNGDGTATLSGTPAANSYSHYDINITAVNGYGGNVGQNITLIVNKAPYFATATGATFGEGVTGGFGVGVPGWPYPVITATGTLPAGVTFWDIGDGAAIFYGTPAAGSAGVYTITLTAGNGIGSSVTQTFTLTVVTVNHAPAGTDGQIATLDGFELMLFAFNFGFTDYADGAFANNFLAVQITTLPGTGTLTLSGVAVNAGDFISVSDLNAGHLIYTPPSGSGTTTFTFQVQDDGGTAHGGIDLDPIARTMTIIIYGIN